MHHILGVVWFHLLWRRHAGTPQRLHGVRLTKVISLWNERYGEIGSKMKAHKCYFSGKMKTKASFFFYPFCTLCDLVVLDWKYLGVIHWVSGHCWDRTRQGVIVVPSEKEEKTKSPISFFQDFSSSTKVLDNIWLLRNTKYGFEGFTVLSFSYLKITSVSI